MDSDSVAEIERFAEAEGTERRQERRRRLLFALELVVATIKRRKVEGFAVIGEIGETMLGSAWARRSLHFMANRALASRFRGGLPRTLGVCSWPEIPVSE